MSGTVQQTIQTETENAETRKAELELLGMALRAERGPDQQSIARLGVSITSLLLRKNADYGSSAWKPPALAPHLQPGDAMLCRMSDKVARIATLSGGASAEVAESLEDSVRDLAGYCLLWLAFKEKEAAV
jgi:hypothetical protein